MSPLKILVVVALIGLCAFGAWHWYTDDSKSDLDQLATEVKVAPHGGRVRYRFWILGGKFVIALAASAAYLKFKSSLRP